MVPFKSVKKNCVLRTKELSSCHKLRFFNPYIFSARYRRPLIFQTKNFVRSESLNLHHQVAKIKGLKLCGKNSVPFITHGLSLKK